MIDIEQARILLAQAVETQGSDFVYQINSGKLGGNGCYYEPRTHAKGYAKEYELDKDDPRRITGCLIGVALSLAGQTCQIGFPNSILDLATLHPELMTEQAAKYFNEAQKVQDVGGTWGAAYAAAEAYLMEAKESVQ